MRWRGIFGSYSNLDIKHFVVGVHPGIGIVAERYAVASATTQGVNSHRALGHGLSRLADHSGKPPCVNSLERIGRSLVSMLRLDERAFEKLCDVFIKRSLAEVGITVAGVSSHS